MSCDVILDTSALLAFMKREPGGEKVVFTLKNAALSAVNFSEAVTVLGRLGISEKEGTRMISDLIKEIVPFDMEQARITAELWEKTRHKGLSFGDRACLALGQLRRAKILTADKAWSSLDVGISIEMVR